MAKKKKVKLDVEKHEIAGHSVQIRLLEDREELWIDGVRRKYYKSERGYTLYDDAYSPPQKSLIVAVTTYLTRVFGDSEYQ